MNNARRTRRNLPIRMHMRHNIMPPPLLLLARNLKIRIRHHNALAHLTQRLLADSLDAELALRLGEIQPQLPPGRVARALREELRHLRAAVPACEGRLVGVEDGAGVLRLHGADLGLEVERGGHFCCVRLPGYIGVLRTALVV